MLFIERQYPVVEQVSRRNGRLGRVQLGVGDLAIGVDIGLLVDAANALEGANVECVLTAQIARMGSLDLAAGFIVQLLFLQRLDLRLGQEDAFFGNLGFQCFQAVR